MNSLLLLLALQTPDPTASSVISKMLIRYNKAVTVVGRINLTQSFQNVKVTVLSTLQYEKPSKFFLHQQLSSSEPKVALVTGDGKHYSYNTPDEQAIFAGKGRLVEAVDQGAKLMDVRDIYQACVKSLVDRSAPLDIAISRLDDLAFLRDQWMNLKLAKDGEGWIVSGDWREYAGQPIVGTVAIQVSKDYDLLSYEIREKRQFSARKQQTAPDILVSRWDVALKIDGPTDPKLFTLVK